MSARSTLSAGQGGRRSRRSWHGIFRPAIFLPTTEWHASRSQPTIRRATPGCERGSKRERQSNRTFSLPMRTRLRFVRFPAVTFRMAPCTPRTASNKTWAHGLPARSHRRACGPSVSPPLCPLLPILIAGPDGDQGMSGIARGNHGVLRGSRREQSARIARHSGPKGRDSAGRDRARGAWQVYNACLGLPPLWMADPSRLHRKTPGHVPDRLNLRRVLCQIVDIAVAPPVPTAMWVHRAPGDLRE